MPPKLKTKITIDMETPFVFLPPLNKSRRMPKHCENSILRRSGQALRGYGQDYREISVEISPAWPLRVDDVTPPFSRDGHGNFSGALEKRSLQRLVQKYSVTP